MVNCWQTIRVFKYILWISGASCFAIRQFLKRTLKEKRWIIYNKERSLYYIYCLYKPNVIPKLQRTMIIWIKLPYTVSSLHLFTLEMYACLPVTDILNQHTARLPYFRKHTLFWIVYVHLKSNNSDAAPANGELQETRRISSPWIYRPEVRTLASTHETSRGLPLRFPSVT